MVKRCEYLGLMLAGGMPENGLKRTSVSSKVLHAVTQQLHNIRTMDCVAALRIQEIVNSSQMVATDKYELTTRLNDKVDLAAAKADETSGPSSGSTITTERLEQTPTGGKYYFGKSGQVHKHLHNYGTQKLWGIICDQSLSMEVKLQATAIFLKTLGVRVASEKTAAAATALCRHFSVLVDDNPDKALASARRLKDILRSLWKDGEACDVPAEFPPTPEDFLKLFPLWHATAYADGPPVPSPLTGQIAVLVYDEQPCRSTKTGCSPEMKSSAAMKTLCTFGWNPQQRVQQQMLEHQHMLQRQQMQQQSDMRDDSHHDSSSRFDQDYSWLKLCPPRHMGSQMVQAGGKGVGTRAAGGWNSGGEPDVLMDFEQPVDGKAAAATPAVQFPAAAVVPVVVAPPPVRFELPGQPVQALGDKTDSAAFAPEAPASAAPVVAALASAAPVPAVPPASAALVLAAPALATPGKNKPAMADVALMLRGKLEEEKAKRAEDAKKEKDKANKEGDSKKNAGEAGVAKKGAEAAIIVKKSKTTEQAKAKPPCKKVGIVAKKGKTQEPAPTKSHKKILAVADSPAARGSCPAGGSCPDDSLAYRGPSYSKVRYYKDSTIYHDAGRKVWRVKPCQGSRRTIKKSFSTNPKKAWEELVVTIRSLNTHG